MDEDRVKFITHNALDKNFSISSDSRATAGQYTIKVKSLISVPDDHSLTTESEHEAEFSFKLTIVDSCSMT